MERLIRCVSVRFADELAPYEPRKWVRIIDSMSAKEPYPELRKIASRIQIAWASEYANSLNLVVLLDPITKEEFQLQLIQEAFLGAEEAKFFGDSHMARTQVKERRANAHQFRVVPNERRRIA